MKTDPRLRERLNWDDSNISLEEFLTDWQRATDDRSYQPQVGDSSTAAAIRFVDALVDLEKHKGRVVVVVAHGGVTVDALRTIAGDASVNEANMDLIPDGVPSCAITQLRISGAAVSVVDYPSTAHLDDMTPHRPA